LRLRGLALVCAMRHHAARILLLCFVLLHLKSVRAQSPERNVAAFPSADALQNGLTLRKTRQSPSDLEIGGELAGLPPGTTRFLTRHDLLALPQVAFQVTGDTNFTGSPKISGVRLEDLAKRIAAAPAADMIVAICDDKYRANYPRKYLASHHPVLVLNVNGQPPAGWPKDSQEHKYDMGPYMISHANFVPAFKILSHSDEPQIPWGVVRLEFRNEKTVFGTIAPRGPRAADAAVQAGYQIARQNCFRCHNVGQEGGQKSGFPWAALSAFASASSKDFGSYVRNPLSKNAKARMPDNSSYDDATIGALTAYFQTFHSTAKP
jgi:mono/diheme cytochrome c family protein